MAIQNETIRSFINCFTQDLQESMRRDKITDYRIARQLSRVRKRIQDDDIDLHEKTINAFLNLNRDIPKLEMSLDPMSLVVGEARDFIYHALHRFTSYHSDTPQGTLDGSLLLSLWRFGPGASNGINGTHFAQKVSQWMTCTEDCASLTRILRKFTPAFARFDSGGKKIPRVTVVKGSVLGTVPKNEDTERTICTEPLGNMAWQLAAGAYIEGALRAVGLDISKQEPKNQELARKGSLYKLLCTIDLKSASDCIKPELIKLLWPPEWVELLMTIRSPMTQNPLTGEYVELNMMSTMGNGFTFPMMTLTLLSLVYAIERSRGLCKWRHVDYRNIGVYGDDIICHQDIYDEVCSTLSAAGLLINFDKSYSEGPFRESCGGDYFHGYDVTPFYPKRFDTTPNLNIVANQLLMWSAKCRVPTYRTLDFLIKNMEKVFLVPCWDDAFSGIRTIRAPKRYRKYVIVPQYQERFLRPELKLLCAIGGYITNGDKGLVRFVPRGDPEYEIDPSCYRPKGWCDGSYPLLATTEEQVYWSDMLALTLA